MLCSRRNISPEPSPPPQYDHLFKVLIIGDSSVGKSNMLLGFADDDCVDYGDSVVGVDFKLCTRRVDGKAVKMHVWDTAGPENYESIASSFYWGADGIIVVYDVTDRMSFEHVRTWMQEIEKYSQTAPRKLIVGNKVDLAPGKRAVSHEEGRELAEEFGVRFIETSARIFLNIEDAFDVVVREMKEHADLLAATQQMAALACSISGVSA